MKISASMACLPGLPLPFVGGVALAVQTVGVSERYVPSCGTDQTSASPQWLMASLRPVVRFAERTLRNISPGRADHSALMLASRITLPHFSVSSASSLPKSAGELTNTVRHQTVFNRHGLALNKPVSFNL